MPCITADNPFRDSLYIVAHNETSDDTNDYWVLRSLPVPGIARRRSRNPYDPIDMGGHESVLHFSVISNDGALDHFHGDPDYSIGYHQPHADGGPEYQVWRRIPDTAEAVEEVARFRVGPDAAVTQTAGTLDQRGD